MPPVYFPTYVMLVAVLVQLLTSWNISNGQANGLRIRISSIRKTKQSMTVEGRLEVSDANSNQIVGSAPQLLNPSIENTGGRRVWKPKPSSSASAAVTVTTSRATTSTSPNVSTAATATTMASTSTASTVNTKQSSSDIARSTARIYSPTPRSSTPNRMMPQKANASQTVKLKWKPLSAAESKALLASGDLRENELFWLKRLIDSLKSGHRLFFVKNLKTLSKEMTSRYYADELMPITTRIVPGDLCGGLTADVIWALGSLGYSVAEPSHRPILNGLVERFCEVEEYTSREVTTTLVGMGKLRYRWGFLSKEVQQDIITAVGQVAELLNSREVGNLLHALSKLSVPWSEFPKSIQASLLESFVKHSKQLRTQEGSMTIYSLGTLGVSLDNATPAVRDHIFTVSLAVLQESKSNIHRLVTQQASNVIYGLAKLGAKWETLPPYLQEGIFAAVINAMGFMNEQEVANTVYSLGCLGVTWSSLPEEVNEIIEKTAVLRFEKMIPQGLSNTIYGMGLMGAPWSNMSEAYQHTLLDSVVHSFTIGYNRRGTDQRGGDGANIIAQAVSNIIYSLGLSNAVWKDLPEPVQTALLNALVAFGPDLKSQELSNVCYGLGQLRADYNTMSQEAIDALEMNIDRLKVGLNEQEVCSTIHGYSRMGAKWANLPDSIKRIFLVSIATLADMGTLCLACVVYSLGQLGVTWEELPTRIKSCFFEALRGKPMQDQSLANLIYGLTQMGVVWDALDEDFKNSILENLSRREAFLANVPQHVSNTIWSLSKMDASWSLLPRENLQKGIVLNARLFSSQETSNTLYGLAMVDASWWDLSAECQVELCAALEQTIPFMTAQELANVMYSLSILTYDTPFTPTLPALPAETPGAPLATTATAASTKKKNAKKNKDSDATTATAIDIETPSKQSAAVVVVEAFDNGTGSGVKEEGLQRIWALYRLVLTAFKNLDLRPEFSTAVDNEGYSINYDQYGMFFEMIRAIPGGAAVVTEIFDGLFPTPTGPSGGIPSRMHARTIHAMLRDLEDVKEGFDVTNEFNGLCGVFPIDAAVYLQDELKAFIEIDGEFHYKQLGQVLRRKDRLKEFLYRYHYPDVPLFRIRQDQCEVIGVDRAGQELATWISQLIS